VTTIGTNDLTPGHYERAEALAEAGDGDARREALAIFEELGAVRAAERLQGRRPT
jgi:hypothetical protein